MRLGHRVQPIREARYGEFEAPVHDRYAGSDLPPKIEAGLMAAGTDAQKIQLRDPRPSRRFMGAVSRRPKSMPL